MTIGWIEISQKKYGGVIYDNEVKHILSKEFDLDLINFEPKYFKKLRYLKIPESLFYLFKLKGERDLWIRDFFSTIVLSFKKTKGKNLVMVHHLDFSGFPFIAKPFLYLLEKLFFYQGLRKTDAIVTVSEYWKNYFLQKDYQNVYKIYNGFDLSNFDIEENKILDFKKKYKLNNKPIIYLGNCQRAKGVVEAYHSLKDLNVYLITSGRQEVRTPAINLNLEYSDYLKLLKSSCLAVTMSKFKEGWCRTAHEAMLCKTPVIGSGLGGMRELLEGGGQIICNDFRKLREKVEYLINHSEERKRIAERGFNFVKKFTLSEFQKNWLDLINKTLK